MGRSDGYKRDTAGALVDSDARGRAALTLRDLQLIDLRDAWASAEAQAGVALHAWYSAARPHRQDAYAAYIAALDREEAAASLLASRLAILAGELL
jgi:hypothetical protein